MGTVLDWVPHLLDWAIPIGGLLDRCFPMGCHRVHSILSSLFNFCMNSLEEIIHQTEIECHKFVYDNQHPDLCQRCC